MKHTKDYWRRQNYKPPLPSHPDPPPTIQCSWYPHEGQCPYMRLGFKSKSKNFSKQKFNGGKCACHKLLMIRSIYYTFVMLNLIPDTPQFDQIVLIVSQINFT